MGTYSDIGKTIYGIAQQVQGNKWLKNNKQPQYEVDPIYKSLAQQGLPQQAINNYTNAVERQTGAGLNAILQGGGDLNMIQGLIGNQQDKYSNMLAQDAMLKTQNLQNLAGQNQIAWNINKYVPYQQGFNKATNQTNSGVQNMFAGMEGMENSVDSAAMAFATGGTSLAGGTGGNSGGRMEMGAPSNVDTSGGFTGLNGFNQYGINTNNDYSNQVNQIQNAYGLGNVYSGGTNSPVNLYNPYSQYIGGNAYGH